MYRSIRVRTVWRQAQPTRFMSTTNPKPEGKILPVDSFAGVSISGLQSNVGQNFGPDISWPGDEEFESTGLASRLARSSRPQPGPSFSIPAAPMDDTTGVSKSLRTPSESLVIPSRILRKKMTSPSPVLIEYHTERGGSSGDTRAPSQSLQHPIVESRQPQNRTPARQPRMENQTQPRSHINLQNQQRRKHRRELAENIGEDVIVSSGRIEQAEPILPPTTVNFETTDLESLFHKHSNSASDKLQAKARRIQLALERMGGDYSRLLPKAVEGREDNPVNRAQSVMARRRDIGINRRLGALNIVVNMVGKEETQSEDQRDQLS